MPPSPMTVTKAGRNGLPGFLKRAAGGRADAARFGAWSLGIGLWSALAVLALAPIVIILVGAAFPTLLGMAGSGDSLFASSLWAAMRNSLLLGGGVAAISVSAALGLVLIAEMAAPPFVGFWEALLFLPFLIPPYQLGLAWSALAMPGSIFGRHLGPAAVPLEHFVFSLAGMAFITATHLVPLVYAMLRGYLAGLGWRYEMAARVHGIGPARVFWRITLPRLAVPLAAGGLIAFLAAVDEFGVPAVLGPYLGLEVLTTAIQGDLDVWPINLVGATRTATVLLGMGLVAWSLYRRYDRAGGLDYSRPRAAPARRDWAAQVASAGFACWTIMTSVVPIMVLVVLAVLRADTAGLRADNLTLTHFTAILTPGTSGFRALSTSFDLAIVSSVTALMLATLIAFAERSGRRSDQALDAATTLLNAMPGVVLAVALVLIWNASWNPLPLYGHTAVLDVAYVTILLPLALRYAKTAAARVEAGLLGAARVHGIGPLVIFWRLVLPLMLPPLLGGFAVAFAFGMREFVTSVLLQPPGVSTVSTFIFNEAQQGNGGSAMAMTVISMAVTLVAVAILRLGPLWQMLLRKLVKAGPPAAAFAESPLAASS